MYGWDTVVLLKHYLESGLSKTAIARQLGVSRRVIYHWITTGQLDRQVSETAAPKMIGAPVVGVPPPEAPHAAARRAVTASRTPSFSLRIGITKCSAFHPLLGEAPGKVFLAGGRGPVLDHGQGDEDGEDRGDPDHRLNQGPARVGGRERRVHMEEAPQRIRQDGHRIVLCEGL